MRYVLTKSEHVPISLCFRDKSSLLYIVLSLCNNIIRPQKDYFVLTRQLLI